MQWRVRFNSAFFSLWRQHGLPSPAGHAARYDRLCGAVDLPNGLAAASAGTSGPLAVATLRDVYRFGTFIGRAIGRLLALPDSEIDRRVDWCGRFNLGISLFDYLCDEAGRIDALLRAEPFRRLTKGSSCARGAAGDDVSPDPTEALLRVLATDIMAELEAEAGPADRRPRPHRLWFALESMMRAEARMARAELAAQPDVDGWWETARTKSAEPFRCMAEWMALGAGRSPAVRDSAAAIGSAVGDCYWLVDDARDLWEDFDTSRWNLFLLAAAKTDPGLFRRPQDPASELRLSRILLRGGWVEGIVAPVIGQLRTTLADAPTGPAVQEEIAGLLAVSMERWL